MGEYQGISLAEKLKIKADSLHSTKNLLEYNAVRGQIVKGAEKAAAEGDYEYNFYDEKLSDPKLLDDLKRSLQSDGFQVDGGPDDAYSEHVGKITYYIRVSWK